MSGVPPFSSCGALYAPSARFRLSIIYCQTPIAESWAQLRAWAQGRGRGRARLRYGCGSWPFPATALRVRCPWHPLGGTMNVIGGDEKRNRSGSARGGALREPPPIRTALTPALGPAQPARCARCTGPLARHAAAVGRTGSSGDTPTARCPYRALKARLKCPPIKDSRYRHYPNYLHVDHVKSIMYQSF